MKIRNKKTGEIVDKFPENIIINTGRQIYNYNSLAELNEEWEDYEEPKEYYFIDEFGLVQQEVEYYYAENKEAVHDKRLEIGNYFETKEEAKQAVEKLKAWKRLKDKGFKFEGYNPDFEGMGIIYPNDCSGNWCWKEDKKDLDLLFGGEE